MQSTSSHNNYAAQFRRRHFEGTPLVLANVWDASSACLVQSLGAEAVATTSAGVAWALGYADGHN
jgi:2-methylisocitrate lyase-like PEP mutase family enzyme